MRPDQVAIDEACATQLRTWASQRLTDVETLDDVMPDLAVVLFSDHMPFWWLRWLRREFRHCSVLIRHKGQWIGYEPMSNGTQIYIIGPYPILPLLRYFRRANKGFILFRPKMPPQRRQPWRPYTCVEAVKRVLGLHAPFVLTPWHLWCRVRRARDLPMHIEHQG